MGAMTIEIVFYFCGDDENNFPLTCYWFDKKMEITFLHIEQAFSLKTIQSEILEY